MQYSPGTFYIDRTGAVVIDAKQFSRVGNFANGLAPVNTRLGSGFMDRSGSIVIAPQFEGAMEFSEGLAAVQLRKRPSFPPADAAGNPSPELHAYPTHEIPKIEFAKWGYIDTSGRMVIKDDFDAAYAFSEGLALTRIGERLFFIDRAGQKTVELNMADVALEYSGNQKFSEGLIVARDMKTDLCGYLDKTGKFAIEPGFKDAANFSEGLARASIIEDHREYLGFIDRTGEYVIPPTFDIDSDFLRGATDFSEGLASIIGGPPTMEELIPGFVYIDKTGEILRRTDYAYAFPFHEGLAAVYSADKNKWGFIDRSGDLVIPLEFDGVGEFSEGLAWVTKFQIRNRPGL
jgi:hypothetical protein